jgi:cell wall-associated NlpC family hydrolase
MVLDRYIGIPFVAHQSTFIGADCWGLVDLFLREELGIYHPSISKDFNTENLRRVEAEYLKNINKYWKQTGEPKIGDCVLFNFMGHSTHVGIIVKPQIMLHTLKGRNSVLERFLSPAWAKRIAGFYTYVK